METQVCTTSPFPSEVAHHTLIWRSLSFTVRLEALSESQGFEGSLSLHSLPSVALHGGSQTLTLTVEWPVSEVKGMISICQLPLGF